MSAFSNLDASSNATGLLGYLDDTDVSLSAMKAYIAATAHRYVPGELVLDVGCGVGHDLVRLASAGLTPVGVDSSAKALARARRGGCAVVRGDAARLPFITGAFAGSRIERVLQHVADPCAVLDEVIRVTRPGGFVAIFEPDYTTFRVTSELVPDGSLPFRFVAVRHPAIGSEVVDLLRTRGCTIDDIVTEQSFAYRLDDLPLDSARLTQRGIDAGALRPELRDAWLQEQRRRTDDGSFHATWSKRLTIVRLGSRC